MSIFDANEVLRVMTNAPPNPLHTLGFGGELLRLNLTEEELWQVARKTSQEVVKILHPDQQDSAERASNALLRDAFEAIKDFKTFRDALAELRKEHNETRSNENYDKRAEDNWRKMISDAEKKATRASEALKAAEARNEDVVRRIRMAHNHAGIVIVQKSGKRRDGLTQIQTPDRLRRAIALRVSITRWNGDISKPEVRDDILARYREKRAKLLDRETKKNRTLRNDVDSGHIVDTHKALQEHGFHVERLETLVSAAMRDRYPAISWGFATRLKELGVVKGTVDSVRAPNVNAVLEASLMPESAFELAYRDAFVLVARYLAQNTEYVAGLTITPEIIDLSRGVRGKPHQTVVGSAFLQEPGQVTRVDKHGFRLGNFPEDLEFRFVCEGAVLATIPSTVVGGGGSNSLQRAYDIRKELRIPKVKPMISPYFIVELID